MSITIDDAQRIAFAPIGSYSPIILDNAASFLAALPGNGRDNACYRQLALLKAELYRISRGADTLECVARALEVH